MKRKKSTTIIVLLSLALVIMLTSLKGGLTSISSVEELGQELGAITLLPTIIVVVLAFVSNNVLFSLLIGFLSGVAIYTISITGNAINPVVFVNNVWQSVSNVLFDIDNIEIVILCLVIGGMIEIIKSSGGFEALAQKLTVRINTPRETGVTAGLLGILIFFDDYANALITGPIMKPIVDRVKVSREKLAFYVDSTSAQVAGIALVSSWIGVEISAIQKGLDVVNSQLDSFSLFIHSIPFAFYCIFCISFVFVNALLDRDFGPMLKAEQRARNGETISEESRKTIVDEAITVQSKVKQRIFVSVGSIILLVIFAVMSFYITGKHTAISIGVLNNNSPFNIENVLLAISYAKTINLISLASLVSSIFALIFGCIFGLFTLKQGILSWLKGVKSLVSTVLLLLTAWCLSDAISNIGATYFAVELVSANVPAVLVPLLIFVACCIISLTSGSFGCMFVVMPIAIPLATKMISMGINISDETYLSLCIGSVVAGSIFGDHCSPVTDCTILSSIGSGCTTIEHCITQLPYSIVCLVISMICGIILTSIGLDISLAIIFGIVSQVLILLLVGKKPI